MAIQNTKRQPIPGWAKLALYAVPGRRSAIAMYSTAYVLSTAALCFAVADVGNGWMVVAALFGFAAAVLAQESVQKVDELEAWRRLACYSK